MSLEKLKARHWKEQQFLKAKQEVMSKPYSSTSAAAKLAGWAFKIFVLVFFALIIIFPFYFMISQSLTNRELTILASNTPAVLFPRATATDPTVFHFDNYRAALVSGYLQSVVFTIGVTSLSILVRLFFSLTLGYALSLNNWKGKAGFFAFFLSLMILPEIALLVGQYIVVVRMGWQQKEWLWFALIAPFTASIFFAYMYKNAFEAIPNSVKESSMLDGANGFKYFVKIALPMVSSTTWTVAILTAFASWNSYTWPALLMSGSAKEVWKPMNLWVFDTGKDLNEEVPRVYGSIRMAGTILAILPMFIIYFVLRKRIMNAISRNGNATKG
ncbi:carbohydrate ABC transporter permease [Mycoplasma struthionis]|uniref:Carbohydrate ABC transporter permease n=1 Tax=Mycoplasma struthionis TaxID=538220 RepID=A0A3G8LFH0_9MOLU|nr:carbohydrate ABC transporter permease [Mycoplasma struthionis]AZG68373.1 carbohydrate ABC transporter permease [Mycoplasma struthionis]AZG68384.1 carbohydrate ABC transporter permease [Mycoplasma struthionis]AZG68950.1 carbohydrate ABC transporter permease [Mycoplasma struthionis]